MHGRCVYQTGAQRVRMLAACAEHACNACAVRMLLSRTEHHNHYGSMILHRLLLLLQQRTRWNTVAVAAAAAVAARPPHLSKHHPGLLQLLLLALLLLLPTLLLLLLLLCLREVCQAVAQQPPVVDPGALVSRVSGKRLRGDRRTRTAAVNASTVGLCSCWHRTVRRNTTLEADADEMHPAWHVLWLCLQAPAWPTASACNLARHTKLLLAAQQAISLAASTQRLCVSPAHLVHHLILLLQHMQRDGP
jgi:hypothetical protein